MNKKKLIFGLFVMMGVMNSALGALSSETQRDSDEEGEEKSSRLQNDVLIQEEEKPIRASNSRNFPNYDKDLNEKLGALTEKANNFKAEDLLKPGPFFSKDELDLFNAHRYKLGNEFDDTVLNINEMTEMEDDLKEYLRNTKDDDSRKSKLELLVERAKSKENLRFYNHIFSIGRPYYERRLEKAQTENDQQTIADMSQILGIEDLQSIDNTIKDVSYLNPENMNHNDSILGVNNSYAFLNNDFYLKSIGDRLEGRINNLDSQVQQQSVMVTNMERQMHKAINTLKTFIGDILNRVNGDLEGILKKQDKEKKYFNKRLENVENNFGEKINQINENLKNTQEEQERSKNSIEEFMDYANNNFESIFNSMENANKNFNSVFSGLRNTQEAQVRDREDFNERLENVENTFGEQINQIYNTTGREFQQAWSDINTLWKEAGLPINYRNMDEKQPHIYDFFKTVQQSNQSDIDSKEKNNEEGKIKEPEKISDNKDQQSEKNNKEVKNEEPEKISISVQQSNQSDIDSKEKNNEEGKIEEPEKISDNKDQQSEKNKKEGSDASISIMNQQEND